MKRDDEADAQFAKALDLKQAPSADKTRMFGVLALLQTLQGDRESAAYSLQRARELAERENDSETAAFAIHTDGLRDFFAGDFDAAGAKFATARTRYAQIDAEADLDGADQHRQHVDQRTPAERREARVEAEHHDAGRGARFDLRAVKLEQLREDIRQARRGLECDCLLRSFSGRDRPSADLRRRQNANRPHRNRLHS